MHVDVIQFHNYLISFKLLSNLNITSNLLYCVQIHCDDDEAECMMKTADAFTDHEPNVNELPPSVGCPSISIHKKITNILWSSTLFGPVV